MLLLKRINAIDLFDELIERGELTDDAEILNAEIYNNGRIDQFEYYIDYELPHGVEEDEFIDFIKNNAYEIRTELGITDDEYEDEDEDEDEEFNESSKWRVISESDDENEYSSQIDETKKLLDSTSNARGVYVRAGGFCPYLAFIRLDALDQEDWPHGINDNSYFTEFEVDFRSGTIEIQRCGIIPFNKDDTDKGYYGFGEKQLMLKTGRKPFRKCRFKSIEALVDKMNTFYDSYVSALEEYKGCGYPYGAEKD